jgi:hypothetical protein
MPIATNPDTGETVYLTDDGRWEKARTAVHPETKKSMAYDGKGWVDVPLRITVNKKADMGRGGAAVEGIRSGVTFNFGDELAGIAGAAPVPPEMRSPLSGPANFIMGLGQLGYEYLTGNDAASKRYEKARDEVRTAQKTAEEQYPGTYMAGQIGGGVAIPLGGALNAATLPARMGRGAALGSIVGGLSGIGDGEDITSRATKGAIGSAAGGVIGAAAPPLIEGGSALIGSALSKPINYIRSAINPDDAASRAIGRAYQGAVRSDPQALNRLDPNELVPGGPQTVLDTLGGHGRDVARSAANLSGEARDTLNRTLDDRFEGQTGRLTGWLNAHFHFPNATATQEALERAARGANNAAYTRAYRDGANGIWTPELERLAGSDSVGAAMRKAASAAGDESIIGGYGAMNPRITFTQDGRMQFGRGPNGAPTYPDLQYWDLVRRELSGLARTAGHGTTEARRYEHFARALNTELDHVVPSYRSARQGAAGFFGAENALEAGQIFVTQNFAANQTRAALARMTPVERQLFQDGFASRYVEAINAMPDRADAVRRIYNSPAAREKIQLALGPQRAQELEAIVRVETIMQQGLRSVQGNSTTTQQLVQLGLAGGAGAAIGAGGGGALGYDPTWSGIVGALAGAGKRGVDRRVAERVAEMLVSNDPAVLRRGIQMIARNQTMMRALRSVDSAGVRVGGYQGATIPGPQLQSPAIGRTEDE